MQMAKTLRGRRCSRCNCPRCSSCNGISEDGFIKSQTSKTFETVGWSVTDSGSLDALNGMRAEDINTTGEKYVSIVWLNWGKNCCYDAELDPTRGGNALVNGEGNKAANEDDRIYRFTNWIHDNANDEDADEKFISTRGIFEDSFRACRSRSCHAAPSGQCYRRRWREGRNFGMDVGA